MYFPFIENRCIYVFSHSMIKDLKLICFYFVRFDNIIVIIVGVWIETSQDIEVNVIQIFRRNNHGIYSSN